MAEADAKREWDQRQRKRRHRMRERGRNQSDRRETQAVQERRFVAEPADDRPNEAALDRRAKQAEAREEVAGSREVEPEPPCGEQREGGLEDRKREPVDEVDGEDAADGLSPQQARKIPERIAGARLRAVDGLRKPQPRQHRG